MTHRIRRRVSGLDWFGAAIHRIAMGVTIGLLAIAGTGKAQTTCPTPAAPIADISDGGGYWASGRFVGDPDLYDEFGFRYQLIDQPGWNMVAGGNRPSLSRTEFQAPVNAPPTTGSNPGAYEVQVHGRCDTTWSEWSPSSTPVNLSDPPMFSDRFGDPLAAADRTCTFVEGQTDSGDVGLGCRIFADDPDIKRFPIIGDEVQFEIGGDDADLFRFSLDRSRIIDGVGDGILDGYYLIHFRDPANFERSGQPDGLYHLTFKVTDAYGLSGTQDFVMRVTDVDESETWTLAPPPPSGANHHRDPHGW